MNTMPGFTAEASLYKTSQHYELQPCSNTAMQRIIPQRIKLRDVRCDCDGLTDICVCDDGSIFNMVLGGGNLP
jgi:hypothetical protein